MVYLQKRRGLVYHQVSPKHLGRETLGKEDTDSSSEDSVKENSHSVEEQDTHADKVFDENTEIRTSAATTKDLWANLFKTKRSMAQSIKLTSAEDNNSEKVSLQEHDLDNVEKAWCFYLIGYFASRFQVGRHCLNYATLGR